MSARSFLVALRTAAEHTADQHPEHANALHPDGIRRGVQEASKIRVGELQEDYPWMERVMRPLAGMSVPCEFEEFAERWRSERVLDRLTEEIEQSGPRLPSRHLDEGLDGVRQDLESLGVFQRLYDGRVNIPDVFRVGYVFPARAGMNRESRRWPPDSSKSPSGKPGAVHKCRSLHRRTTSTRRAKGSRSARRGGCEAGFQAAATQIGEHLDVALPEGGDLYLAWTMFGALDLLA